jgi:hypothetical protein
MHPVVRLLSSDEPNGHNQTNPTVRTTDQRNAAERTQGPPLFQTLAFLEQAPAATVGGGEAGRRDQVGDTAKWERSC